MLLLDYWHVLKVHHVVYKLNRPIERFIFYDLICVSLLSIFEQCQPLICNRSQVVMLSEVFLMVDELRSMFRINCLSERCQVFERRSIPVTNKLPPDARLDILSA